MVPLSLSQAVALAKLYEEKYLPSPKPVSWFPKYQNTKPYTNASIHNATSQKSLPPLLPTPPASQKLQPSQTPRHFPIRRISPLEMQLRRDKGLCFTCDEKYSLNHRCPNKHMMVFETEEDEGPMVEEPESPASIETVEQTMEPEESSHHLSFNALRGFLAARTMRFVGKIHGSRVQILLDSRSSDNFIQPRIAKSLKLPIQPSPQFKVMVGNGQVITAEGMIEEL